MSDLEKRVEELEAWKRRVESTLNRFIPLGPAAIAEPALPELDWDKIKKEIRESEKRARSNICLTNGDPVTGDHREIQPSGQQKGYVVLTSEERAKGFVRPVRRVYTHLLCDKDTTMAESIAETYARDPKFYNGTFCCDCAKHFPLDQFVWKGTQEQVGS